MEKTIMARFAFFKSFLFSSFCLTIIIWVYWITLTFPGGATALLGEKAELSGFIVIAWIGAPFAGIPCAFLLYQILFKRGAAIWLEGSSIVYLNKRFLSVDRSDILSISVASAESRPSIRQISLHLKGGKDRRMGLGFLKEDRDQVLSDLTRLIKSAEHQF
jgi:hypothetical protein